MLSLKVQYLLHEIPKCLETSVSLISPGSVFHLRCVFEYSPFDSLGGKLPVPGRPTNLD